MNLLSAHPGDRFNKCFIQHYRCGQRGGENDGSMV